MGEGQPERAGGAAPATVIRGLDWLVAWDATAGGHCYLRGADLAFADDRIVQAGGRYAGPVAQEIDGRDLVALPGLIDLHAHPMSEPMNKGVTDDAGNPKLGFSGLYDIMPAYGPDEDGMRAAAEVAYAELLLSGVTTLVDLSVPYDGWLERLAGSGLRGIAAPMFRSARWYSPDGHSVAYEWAEDSGKAAFAAALRVVDAALAHDSGRLSAMVTPSQIDTCTPELLRDAQAAARERGILLHTHAAQSLVEFAEMTRRHGVTPIRWLDELDLLAPDSIVAHAIFLDSHPWVHWGAEDDLLRLAGGGTAVAHCPTVFLRRGILLQHFAGYRAAGLRLGIGTDTFPHNMLEELRMAALAGRLAAPRFEMLPVAEVFHAATAGAAEILGRDDLGRLAAGAKADLLLVDGRHPAMRPLRDPLRSLIHCAADRAVRDVFVDGEPVVRDGVALNLDRDDALARLDVARARADAAVPDKDWGGRSAEQLSPLSLPVGNAAQSP